MNRQFGPGSTVLVVGDPSDGSGGIAAELERAGFIPLSVPNGETALRVVELHGDAVDAMITSIQLPGMADGWKVGRSFQARKPDCAVVYGSEGMFEQPAARRLMGFINKEAHPKVALATLISAATG